jgi:hypothetical protein
MGIDTSACIVLLLDESLRIKSGICTIRVMYGSLAYLHGRNQDVVLYLLFHSTAWEQHFCLICVTLGFTFATISKLVELISIAN